MVVAVILASGKGTRLMPLSTALRPKQYLDVITGKTLIEDTIDRVKNIVGLDNVFVVCSSLQEQLAKDTLHFLNDENLIFEPEMKETLASITHAISYINKLRGDVTYLFLPSDHYIPETLLFESSIKEGLDLYNSNQNLVLFGLKPTEPNTGFGYIETKKEDNHYKILSFIEKPKLEIAEKIWNLDNYFWGTFIFFTNKDIVYNALRENYPKQYELLIKLDQNIIDKNDYFKDSLVDNFSRSILEKLDNMKLVKAKYQWFDIGSFDSLFEVLEQLGKHDKVLEIKKLIEIKK
jgi:mannose-1-phosphate guanylyltransferase